MGFTAVYRSLMEMFPQIDIRLLKAVAIEHSKDADTAATVVLTEILPYWSKQSLTSSAITLDQIASGSSSKALKAGGLPDSEVEEEVNSLSCRRNRGQLSPYEQGVITIGYDTSTHLPCAKLPDLVSANKALNSSAVSQSCDSNDGNGPVIGNNESEEVILLGKTDESFVDLASNKVSTAMPNECGYVGPSQLCANMETNGEVSLNKCQYADGEFVPEQTRIVMQTPPVHTNGLANDNMTSFDKFHGLGATDVDIINCATSQEIGSCLDCPLKIESPVAQFPENGFQLEFGSNFSVDSGKLDASGSSDLTSDWENSMNEKSNIESDSTTVNSVVTRSGQICRIDLLEEMIEDARNNKKNLFKAMESVMNMMKEVEIQEKAAEEAKAAAVKGGLDIYVKMEELKQMLAHARETNAMHSGEIYGEKAILATEARELQSRLLNLSEERDRSLAVLDEMRETLEGRLVAAEEMRKEAEKEKFEKEESARASLAEQEAFMEKVVLESKLLHEQAEENSKLREFLMDRGHVVDSLQGEISVICQDVTLLKAKFDERVPLSKSVTSSQTTCILASSGSSMKSLASLAAEQDPTSETLEKSSPAPSAHADSPKDRVDDKIVDEWRQLSDDGWDLFENETELISKTL